MTYQNWWNVLNMEWPKERTCASMLRGAVASDSSISRTQTIHGLMLGVLNVTQSGLQATDGTKKTKKPLRSHYFVAVAMTTQRLVTSNRVLANAT